MEFAAVIVEASLPDILDHRYKSDVRPASVIGAAVAIMVEYCVPVIFAGHRQLSRHVTESILKRFYAGHERKTNAENES